MGDPAEDGQEWPAGFTLVAAPGAIVEFDRLPPRSIALDGYVQGPQIDATSQRYSFDHHAGCIRLATSATCRQVLDALCLGLMPTGFTVFVNDVDADVALSVALLANPGWHLDPRVRRLVDVVASRDAHGPAYPSPDPLLGHAFAAVLGGAASVPTGMSRPGLHDELRAWVSAIARFVETGIAPEVAVADQGDIESEITHRGSGWVMVHSLHPVFDVAYRAGYRRLVAYQPAPGGTWAYTVARQSDFVDRFPVGPGDDEGSILAALAMIEPGWGGASTIGGAPRHPDGSRSSLTPDRVFDIVESTVIGQGREQGSSIGRMPIGEGDPGRGGD